MTVAEPGEVLRFDLPPTAAVANLTGPATGFHRLVARPPVESSATVIDTADHRLLDWGVELSRVVETGTWVLRAPRWSPPLAAETVSPQAEDDLPPELADVLVPFRRGGILGPKLRVETLSRSFSLLAADDAPIGDLTDQRHRVSNHSGQVVSYRDVTVRVLTPNPGQAQAIAAAFTAGDAAAVDEFATLATRLGLAGHGHRRSALSARASIEDFVAAQFESRWRRLLLADLYARTGLGDDAALREGVLALRVELSGLEGLLEPNWAQATEQLAAIAAESARPLQHTERWLRLLDVLAQASSAPPLTVAGRVTGPVLAQELEAVMQTLFDQCRTLEPYSSDARWARALQVANRAVALSTLARDVFGKPAKQLRRHLEPVAQALESTLRPDSAALSRDLHNLSTAEVFEAGRAYERTMLSVDYARETFVREWPGHWDGLRGRIIRPRVPHSAQAPQGQP
ncbi:hypothetical protein [Micropruina sp.]|uniref:hypothetical protein n=1 Tax=Micropruina sp. TaxID=2737536 RepID=UPI0039E23FDF